MDFEINKDGYIITKAKMASIEPMNYLGEEIGETPGKIYKVFRDESEVFNNETIKSFEGKPLTLTHPSDEVNATNWKNEAIGHIQNVRREGNFLVADAYINDEDAIKIIKEQGLKEVSCGYESKLIKRDGKIWQTNIRGNHLAVVTEGRAGKECKLGDTKKQRKGKFMNFIDMLKAALKKAQKTKDSNEAQKAKDSEDLKAEEIQEQNADVIELLQEALNGAEALNSELEATKTELSDLKKQKDSDNTNENTEMADLKAKIEALEKENSDLKAQIERLKNESETNEAISDAKANFSNVKLTDTKNARSVYTKVIIDSKAFELKELEKLTDGEVKAIYLGLRANKKTQDNSNSVLNKMFDSKPQVIDFNKKFGGK